jgi:hypothetical protein
MLTADGVLTFRNAAVDADVAHAPRQYRARWCSFDNATGATTEIGETVGRTTRIEAPNEMPRIDGMFVKVELSSDGGPASWSTPVSAYFHYEDGTWRLVGFERLQ